MDESWLSVRDASIELDVSPQRVRSLLDSGSLAGHKLGRMWFIDPVTVRRRAALGKRAGRPLSAANAWRMLAVLDRLEPVVKASDDKPVEVYLPFPLSAVERSRLRALLWDMPGPEALGSLLSARADVRRVRAHPGVLKNLPRESMASAGAGRAVAARGGGVAEGGLDRYYVPARHQDALVRRYKMRDDVEGNIELAVIPPEVDPVLLPRAGRPVPLAVAWVDLLDDPDTRARNAARFWAHHLPRHLVVADGRRR